MLSSVLTTAIISTAVIFASFALSALCSRRRSWFFLGSILASALGILSWSSLLNLWLGSAALFRIELYIGLAIFCIYGKFYVCVTVLVNSTNRQAWCILPVCVWQAMVRLDRIDYTHVWANNNHDHTQSSMIHSWSSRNPNKAIATLLVIVSVCSLILLPFLFVF
jgi:hypothetical protein